MFAPALRLHRELSVRIADDGDRDEIDNLLAAMMPGADIPGRRRWLYDTNPAGRALTWVATAGTGEVVGCTSFFPFKLWLEGTTVRAALGGDAYVLPEFRRVGLGRMLHDASRKAMRAHDIACMFGAPGAMNVTPLVSGGSRIVGEVARWARPLRGVPGLVARTFDRVLRPGPAQLDPMLPDDGRVDLVWRAAREEQRLCTVRNAAFYSWRFLDAPGGQQTPFVIVADGLPIGACALEPIEVGRVMRIVDMIAIPGAWHACLSAIAHHTRATSRARILDVKLMAGDARRRRMWLSAFRERETKPFLCMRAEGGDLRLLDGDRWFYGGADSDLAGLA
ncbi:MAG: GNAT family N-acetyltransferase [Deltaproteobacteria bacterium]|nr:GNAT family N-acetyltransferase [Deltaproteobacteria bacterium]